MITIQKPAARYISIFIPPEHEASPALTGWALSSWCFSKKETPAARESRIVLIKTSVFAFLATGSHGVKPAGSSFGVSSRLRSAPHRVLLPSSSTVSSVCRAIKLMCYILTAPTAMFAKS